MFLTAVENFILFSSLVASGGFLVAWAARLMIHRGLWQAEPFTLTRIYAVALALPPIVSAWLVAASLLPQWWLGEEGFESAHSAPLHQLHLLGELTSSLEPGLSYAILLFAAAASFFAAYSSLRGYSRVSRIVARLGMNAALPPPEQIAVVERVSDKHQLEVGLVMSNYPLSFVWGFWRSKLVISSALLHTLTAEQLGGVIEHEAAHHLRRDNLVKLFFSAASYLSLVFPLSRLVLRWRAEQVEFVCDEVAAGNTLAPLEIADALVTLRRCPIALGGATWSGFISSDVPSLERRIHRLIGFADEPPTRKRIKELSQTPRVEAISVTALFTVTLFAASIIAPLAVHHVTEYIIRIF